MNNRNDAVSLVLTDANCALLIALVRKEVRQSTSNEHLDHFAELLTDMNKQWRGQVIGRVGEQSNP